MPDTSNTTFNWKQLLRRLERQKAVLLLGPEVPLLGQEDAPPIREALQAYVKTDLADILQAYDLEKLEYYQDDGFFHIREDYKAEAIYPIVNFYKELKVSPVHQKLAALPFPLIFSLSPDDIMPRALEQANHSFTAHHYDKSQYDKAADDALLNFTPSLDHRLFYQIFGSIHDERSLILSYDDLFEFLQRIFNNYHLPDTVRETIRDANCFVFVGFSYSKWYLKLLLRLMHLHEKVKTVYGMDQPDRPELETFFVNEFDMNFTRMGTRDFIEQLYVACDEAGLLLSDQTVGKSVELLPQEVVQAAEKAIGSNEPKRALQVLADACQAGTAPEACCRDQLQLSARLAALQKDNAKGILDYRDYTLQYNILINDLLELIQQHR